MVNKVDGNSYYDYVKPKKIDIPDTGEKFDLGYGQNEFSSELKDKKEDGVSDKERTQASERDGVRLDISSGGQSAGTGSQKQAEERPSWISSGQAAMLGTIQAFFTTIIAAIKDFFYNIWNDPQSADDPQEESAGVKIVEITEYSGTEEVSETTGTVETSETTKNAGTTGIAEKADVPADEEYLDRKIRQHLQKGDVDQAINLLTDNGRKTVARNSTLLTCYDKNGRVVEPNASVQARTLYGDRNTRKL